MEPFKSRYNYFILFLRVLFFIFSCFLCIMFIYRLPALWESSLNSLQKIAGGIAGAVLLFFMLNRSYKLLRYQRFNLILEEGLFITKDVISGRKTEILLAEIKGFSTSKYPTRIWDFKEIIIYLTDGRKMELPQFLFLNFSLFSKALQKAGIKYLGHEHFKWKFFDDRVYFYDNQPH